jgi:hypothetical protein
LVSVVTVDLFSLLLLRYVLFPADPQWKSTKNASGTGNFWLMMVSEGLTSTRDGISADTAGRSSTLEHEYNLSP